MSSTIGRMSIHVTWCFPRNGTQSVRNSRRPSLSEPGAVSFLQPQSDLSHHPVHFGVRQGALRASESQGKRDTLAPFRKLRAAVLVEGTCVLQQITGRLFDCGEDGARRDGLLHDDCQVALDG